MDMNDIEYALKQRNIVDAMHNLGFDLLPQSKEFPDDYFFMQKKDNELIVFYSAINITFYTYPKANKRSLI